MQPSKHHVFTYGRPFTMESGKTIPGFHLAYTTLGELRPGRKVVWIFHALTANSNPEEWWPGLVGEGRLFDAREQFIICVNMPGSCYGSMGPLSENPATGKQWLHQFPFFTPRDMIRTYQFLKNDLGIEKIHIGIGGSMGGQQLLEWAIEEPALFEHIIPIATNAVHSAWGRAFNASQRMCIETDTSWKQDHPEAGMQGMEVARSIALLSYRHYHTYAATQIDEDDTLEQFRSESYQRYQGQKLAKRFNAFSYYALSKGMDSHNVGRNRGGIERALSRITAKTLSMGVDSDILYPIAEQAFIASKVPGASLCTLHSLYGHDGFLLEFDKIEEIIRAFVNKHETPLDISK